ncbi:hypothetical protein [uncultured Dokdonia sp.]|uniref:hypothetical protein n=1 Tax=uncultured Dokdonia sp. TaxID=575653 RepID=UPI0026156670|nr:hypothetical protein [uncultured Dokdonia sp.]
MNTLKPSFIFIFFCTFLVTQISFAQTEEQKAMAKLSFMIGDWKGTGSSYPKDQNKPYDVLSKVRYDLDGELLVLRHRGTRDGKPILSLHTIIYYNVEEKQYYYNAFRKQGTRPFTGKIVDGKLICTIGNEYRLIFRRTPEGLFNEYGEKLIDGVWTKNFEDLLYPTSEITF